MGVRLKICARLEPLAAFSVLEQFELLLLLEQQWLCQQQQRQQFVLRAGLILHNYAKQSSRLDEPGLSKRSRTSPVSV